MNNEYTYYFVKGTRLEDDGLGWMERIYKIDKNNLIISFYSLDKRDDDYLYKKWYKSKIWTADESKEIINIGKKLSDGELFVMVL